MLECILECYKVLYRVLLSAYKCSRLLHSAPESSKMLKESCMGRNCTLKYKFLSSLKLTAFLYNLQEFLLWLMSLSTDRFLSQSCLTDFLDILKKVLIIFSARWCLIFWNCIISGYLHSNSSASCKILCLFNAYRKILMP